MKKTILILATLLSLSAFGQETAANFMTRIRATNTSQVIPTWYYNRLNYVSAWVEANRVYSLDATDTTASKVITRTIGAAIYLDVADTANNSKITTRQDADLLYTKVGDTIASKILTRKLADPLYLNEADFDSLILGGVATSLADDGTVSLPSMAGLVWITADTAGVIDEYMCVAVSTDGTVILTPNVSTNVDDADTDAKLCAFDGGTTVTVRNRLGYRRTIKIKYMR